MLAQMRQSFTYWLYRLWGRLPLPWWLRRSILWVGNQKFLVGCAAVVIDEQGRVLLFRHTYRPEMPWGLPGGWLKKNEDPARAVEREIREESGLEVEVLRPVWVGYKAPAAQLDMIFLGKMVGGAFRPSAEVIEACFFTVEEFPPVYPQTFEVMKGVVREYYRTS